MTEIRWQFPFRDKVVRPTVDSDAFRGVDLTRETLLPIGAPHPGAFQAPRHEFFHTGVDLYCTEGEPVYAVEDGIVVAIDPMFTGQSGNEDRWNTTQAVLVEGASGVIVYGEIAPESSLRVDTRIQAGEIIGRVMTVMKIDEGRPRSMLHLELYSRGTRAASDWSVGASMPAGLRDPTPQLQNALTLGDSHDRNPS